MTRAPRPPAARLPSAPRPPRQLAKQNSAAAQPTASQSVQNSQISPHLQLLAKIKDENAVLKAQLEKLETDLKNSRHHAKFVEESVFNIRQAELDRAREKGHQEMLNKIQSLWRSEHFGTELLIGTNKIMFSRLT